MIGVTFLHWMRDAFTCMHLVLMGSNHENMHTLHLDYDGSDGLVQLCN
jgi:hypothetical protein